MVGVDAWNFPKISRLSIFFHKYSPSSFPSLLFFYVLPFLYVSSVSTSALDFCFVAWRFFVSTSLHFSRCIFKYCALHIFSSLSTVSLCFFISGLLCASRFLAFYPSRSKFVCHFSTRTIQMQNENKTITNMNSLKSFVFPKACKKERRKVDGKERAKM